MLCGNIVNKSFRGYLIDLFLLYGRPNSVHETHILYIRHFSETYSYTVD